MARRPTRTPATFNIIPYVEAEFGAWYIRGGLPRIADALAQLASPATGWPSTMRSR